MSDAIFKIPKPQLLSKIVDAIDGLYQDMAKDIESDTKGDVYESLLAKLSTAGVNGQFRTPRHIIRMIVEILDPKPDETICDPACGTSGFLVAAGEYLKEKYHDEIFYKKEKKAHYNNDMFFGYDMDRTMLRVGAMNMMTHGVENPNIDYRDSLSEQNTDTGKYSMILANPPFKGSLDADTVSPDLLKVCKTKKTELLFLALFLRCWCSLRPDTPREKIHTSSLNWRTVLYIVQNGMMTDFAVMQESPFTDKGEVGDIFTDVTLWSGIMKTIKMINANAREAA
jgi:type I restriction enzyme M protein